MGNEIRRIYIADKKSKSILKEFAVKVLPLFAEDHLSYTDAKQLMSDIKSTKQCQSEVLIVESDKVLSALSSGLWTQLRAIIKKYGVTLIVRQIPSTWTAELLASHQSAKIATQVLIDVINNNHKERSEWIVQKQKAGIKKAQDTGVHIGRKADIAQYQEIDRLLRAGRTYKNIERELKCSSRTIIKAKVWAASDAASSQKE